MNLIIGSRKLIHKNKGGAIFSVPVLWLNTQKLKAGDKVFVAIDESGKLIISKEGSE